MSPPARRETPYTVVVIPTRRWQSSRPWRACGFIYTILYIYKNGLLIGGPTGELRISRPGPNPLRSA